MHFIKQKKEENDTSTPHTIIVFYICEYMQIYNFYATDTKKNQLYY